VEIKLLYKSGCKLDPANYRGIALLSHASKIFERIILERLSTLIVKLEDCIPDTQFGFMKGKGITDALFMSRGLISHGLKVEGYQIFQCFIDLKKAYDVVDRSILWEVLKRFGLPDKLVRVVQAFHDGAQATVNVEGHRGVSFTTTNGLK
jgi:hypothetical protein